MTTIGGHVRVMAPLSAVALAYALVPDGWHAGLVRDLAYDVVGLLCVLIAFAGLRRLAPGRRTGWLLVLLGLLGWVCGDALFSLQARLLSATAYPAPADLLYLGSYVLVAAGLLVMVRRRGQAGDLPAILDAVILATGAAVVAGVFVIAPVAADSSLTLLGKLTSSAYPIADVLVLGILVRLWTTPGARTMSFRLLLAAFALNLVGDAVYTVTTLMTGLSDSLRWNDELWLVSYVLVAGAVCAPSGQELTEPAPGREDLASPLRRLVVLTGGLLLPALALAADGLDGGGIAWPILAGGSVALSFLVLGRMAGLLGVVRAQAVQLAALARSDPLTGAPNRRTWDHELSRACQIARAHQTPLTVALLDLDHFKHFNDAFGHPVGDLLLREATAVWTELLGDRGVLARYGGEEFAVLLPGRTPEEVRPTLLRMLAGTPRGQTFSAGVAQWDPETDPSTGLAAADVALYRAKRSGRNQIWSSDGTGTSALPVPAIVFQPIVDLLTRKTLAVEALSRFEGQDPATVFAEAHHAGLGPELEALAIRAALAERPPGVLLSVNVGMDAITTAPVTDVLAGDLSGVVIEITEHTDITHPDDVARTVQDLRGRGALIAIDDWGTGFSNLDRLLLLQPEIVKLDMSLVRAVDSHYHQATIRSVTSWADAVGARVCAEGIETEREWRLLQGLGVHLGQGYLFGRPAPVLAALTS